MSKHIIQLMPDRSTWHLYREPYFGGGSTLLQLNPHGLSEAVNDIDSMLTNFWRVLADEELFEKFHRKVLVTPFSQAEWELATAMAGLGVGTENSVDLAVQFFVRARQSRQGLMQDFATPTRRLRRNMNENVSAWLSAVDGLPDVHNRLRRVEIRTMDAPEFIATYDDFEALFYCDPTYLPETRTAKETYDYEMTVEQHIDMLDCLSDIQGKFILSGYNSELYALYESRYGWNRKDIVIDVKASSAKSKRKVTECLWYNY